MVQIFGSKEINRDLGKLNPSQVKKMYTIVSEWLIVTQITEGDSLYICPWGKESDFIAFYLLRFAEVLKKSPKYEQQLLKNSSQLIPFSTGCKFISHFCLCSVAIKLHIGGHNTDCIKAREKN